MPAEGKRDPSSVSLRERVFLIVGITSLFYAYLYFVGYFFLKGYYSTWGINPIEIGFSLVDYATVSIQVVFGIIIWLLFSFMVGVISGKRFARSRIRIERILLILIPLALPLGYVIFIEATYPNIIKNRISIYFEAVTIIISFLLGFFYLKWKDNLWEKFSSADILNILKDKKAYWPALVVIVIIAILLPNVSHSTGVFYAKSRVDYSFPVFFNISLNSALKPPSTIIVTKSPILVPIVGKYLLIGENKYKGLIPITHKKDFIYFVVDNSCISGFISRLAYEGSTMASEMKGALRDSIAVYKQEGMHPMIDSLLNQLVAPSDIGKERIGKFGDFWQNSHSLLNIMSYWIQELRRRMPNEESKLALIMGKIESLDKRLADYKSELDEAADLFDAEGKRRNMIVGINKNNVEYLHYSY